MSALCLGPCRPAKHGGPRAPLPGSHLCQTCETRLAEHLRDIAGWWPALTDRLGRDSADAMAEKVKGTRAVGLVLNETVSDGMAEIQSWVLFVARLVIDERDVRAPTVLSVPSIAAWLADWHAVWLASHHDPDLASAIAHEAKSNADRCARLAAPTGARKLELPLRCTEHTTTDLGERVPCAGTMHAWVSTGASMLPDLVCGLDDTHRVDPATWTRPTFRKRWDAKASADLVRALLDQQTGT